MMEPYGRQKRPSCDRDAFTPASSLVGQDWRTVLGLSCPEERIHSNAVPGELRIAKIDRPTTPTVTRSNGS